MKMSKQKCFNDMTEDEIEDYLSERDGYVEDGIGLNSDGHEFRCDCEEFGCGVALFLIKEN